jgi:hypothetical protein
MCAAAEAQVVRTEPAFPTESDSVRIIFDASKGSGGLAGFTGDIWAHTGVLTNLSTSQTNWRYVVAGWSENKDKAKLKPLGNNLWELKIGPSIRTYYGVPATEKILKMAFVFRNSGGTREGKNEDGSDIFADVFEAGLNISFVKPDREFLAVDPGSAIDIQITSTGADSVVLFLDSNAVFRNAGNNLNFALQAGNSGYHEVVAKGFAKADTVVDTFTYLVKGDVTIAELPAGVKDGINYKDDHTVVLVLYAPFKDFSFVIGDFNNWKINDNYLMNRTPDGKRFWLEVGGLDPATDHQFQYLVDGDIRIADPYSEKLSDPWNDIYITNSTYPNLIPYPAGKTTQPVSTIRTGQKPYAWKTTGYVSPPKEKLVIYELLVRDFLASHDFNTLADTLDYLKNLGINAIELMPVNEFEGNESWGYNPSFFFAVDKYYGPKDDFKAFVDSAHRRGIAVIIDMVLNHSFGQSPMVRLYWDSQNNRPAANNPWYNTVTPNTVYSWGYDFNHQSLETQRFVDSVNTYWMTEYRVDGFRFDHTKGFTNVPGEGSPYDASRITLLKRMADRMRAVNPGVLIILEHYCDNTEEKELSDYGLMLWGHANGPYRLASSGWYGNGAWDFSDINYQKRGWNEASLVGCMENHDEERLMYDCITSGNIQNPQYRIRDLAVASQRMEQAANFFIPLPGPKMIWMFGELGYDYSINLNGRTGNKPIRWDYFDNPSRKRLYQVYSALNGLKTSQALFSTADFFTDFKDTAKIIRLNSPAMNAAIFGNFGIRQTWVTPGFQHDGWWYEYWTGDSLQVLELNGRISLKPGEYRLYTDVKLTKPDIISGMSDYSDMVSRGGKFTVFPNPASDRLWVDTRDLEAGEVTLRLLDIQGRQVTTMRKELAGIEGELTLDIGQLDPGVYFLELQNREFRHTVKWIKQ